MTLSVTLADGRTMPQLGLGVFLVSDTAECEASVRTALQAGYRLIDTAFAYRNEAAVGRGIRSSGVARDEIFLTTKLWPSEYPYEKAQAAIGGALERLDCGPIDLLLLHQPAGDIPGAWRAMEDAVDAGVVRSIGVSNFTVDDLEKLNRTSRRKPVVNQVELHPYFQQPDLLPYLMANDIVAEAWYPIGHGSKKLLAESAVVDAAVRHGRSPVQVILRWHMQRGFVAIPKSTNPDHIRSNIDIFDFALTDAEVAAIDALGKDRPMLRIPRWLMSAALPHVRPRPKP